MIDFFNVNRKVAPFAGAWIEIPKASIVTATVWSLPSRGRGLKCATSSKLGIMTKSLPSRGRGLKFAFTGARKGEILSLPSRGRGLKSKFMEMNDKEKAVAPFAGAWIEIQTEQNLSTISKSLPSRGRGLKCFLCVETTQERSRSLRGGVD